MNRHEQSQTVEYKKGAQLLINSGFCDALIEVHSELQTKEYMELCELAIKIGKEIVRFVNYIKFMKSSVTLILDPVFDMNSIYQFDNKNEWLYFIDALGLYKGYYRQVKGYPTIYIVKPVIWVKEGRA